MSFSRIFAAGHRSKFTFVNQLTRVEQLNILPVFHMDGMMEMSMVVLIKLASKPCPLLRRCLSMMGEIPSGPTALEFFETLMASLT